MAQRRQYLKVEGQGPPELPWREGWKWMGSTGQGSGKQMSSGRTALSQKAWLVTDVLREQPFIINQPATVRISQRGF